MTIHVQDTPPARISSTFKQALALGIETVVRHHLQGGANVNARDDRGQTPLIIAASKGHAKICSILLDAGADPFLKDNTGSCALDLAISNKKANVWELLQKYRANPEPPRETTPPVHDAFSFAGTSAAEQKLDAVVEEEHVEFDLSEWCPDIELAPPPEDISVRADVQVTQKRIGYHRPIDVDEDWSDIEIELPDLAARRRRIKDNEEEVRWLGDARTLILTALRDGSVPENLIDTITPIMDTDGEDDALIDYAALLRNTLGDLGIKFTDDDSLNITDIEIDEETEDRFDAEAAEAMSFMRSRLKRKDDPLTHYFGVLAQAKVLTRADENAIGRSMEEGMSKAVAAIARSAPAIAKIADTIDKVERGQILWELVFADDPAYSDGTDGVSSSDDEDVPDDDSADAVENTQSPNIPSALASGIAELRGTISLALTHEGNGQEQTLGQRLQALGLRVEFVEHLRIIVEKEEPDEDIRRDLASSLAQTGEGRLRLFHNNQRLVFSIARRYWNRGIPIMDVVQEANLGLLKAIDKFDYNRGIKFSTYATWWIRQAITRAIADKSRLIRVPVHMVEFLNKVRRAKNEFEILHGRSPLTTELSDSLGIGRKKVELALKLLEEPVFLEDADENGESLADKLVAGAPSHDDVVLDKERTKMIQREMADLKPQESRVLCMRFGIGMESDHTLEEVGQLYGVTRERIRQIEAKALMKLQNPLRAKKLRALL